MVDKIGTKEYLGIKINYDNEKILDKFSLDTLKDRYFTGEETHAQEAFARASVFGATFKGVTDFELAQRLYSYSSRCWFMFSTPILSNGEPSVGFLLAASLIMYLTAGLVFHLIMMRTFGWQARVEVSVDTGETFVVMVYLLLTVVSLLVQSPLCML